jgi:uncharacterized protein (DUF4415 family)
MTTRKRATSPWDELEIGPTSSSRRGAGKQGTWSPPGASTPPESEDTRVYTRDELLRMGASGEALATPDDAPTYPVPEWFWKGAVVVRPGDPPKASIHLRVDADVLEWFRSKGKGHLTRMNAVLRAHMEAERARAPSGADAPKVAAE